MDQPSSPPIPIIQSHVKNMGTLVNADANTDNPLHTYHIQTGHLANEPPKQSECRSWDRQQRESASFRFEQAYEEYVNDMGAYEIIPCLIVITGVSKPELGAQLMLVHSDPDWSLNTGICGYVCFPELCCGGSTLCTLYSKFHLFSYFLSISLASEHNLEHIPGNLKLRCIDVMFLHPHAKKVWILPDKNSSSLKASIL